MQDHRIHALLLALFCGGALATTLPARTTRDAALEAQRVCCATCASSEPRIDPRTGVVFTYVRFDLLEDLKGISPHGTIELRLAGGRVGNTATVVPGMPRFQPGEEAVLLLGRTNILGYPVLQDAGRGVLRLRREKDGPRCLASPVSGFDTLAGVGRITLSDFRGALKAAVAEAERR